MVKIVRLHSEGEAREKAISHGVGRGKRKYLFFHSKQILTLLYQVKLKLIDEKLILPGEAEERLNFVTFGRENAINEYSDCDVVIFVGLHHKPDHAIKALLSGEGFKGDSGAVKQDVKTGELIQQLQQGIGRGQMRVGERQAVYFFHHKLQIFAEDIEKAFPACNFAGSPTFLMTDEEVEAMEKAAAEGFDDLTKSKKTQTGSYTLTDIL